MLLSHLKLLRKSGLPCAAGGWREQGGPGQKGPSQVTPGLGGQDTKDAGPAPRAEAELTTQVLGFFPAEGPTDGKVSCSAGALPLSQAIQGEPDQKWSIRPDMVP